MTGTYENILLEMNKELNAFSKISDNMNGYQYESKFRAITDKYNQELFQASQGKVGKSKNGRHKVQTSFGEIVVKKKVIH